MAAIILVAEDGAMSVAQGVRKVFAPAQAAVVVGPEVLAQACAQLQAQTEASAGSGDGASMSRT